MVDVSDPAIAQAYSDVRKDTVDTTYAIFGYASNTKIGVQNTGTGGWDEFIGHFKDDEAQFGFIRVTTGDNESKRVKFIFVSWVGETVGPLKRAKVSVHKASVKEIVRDYAAEIHAENRDELDEELAMAKVKKAGGANYEGQKCLI